MEFRAVTLSGFRSFRQKSRFEIGSPGLIQVLGRNEIEPELNSNGAGKSTLFEALQWVLFGRTSRNLRAGDVATWEGLEPCEVVLECGNDQHSYIVRRAWNPNQLVLTTDGVERVVAQSELEQAVGYTPETFLYSVFHAQAIENFATLTPTQQLEVYTAALRLDLWEELSDKASATALPLKTDIIEKQKTLAWLKGTIAAMQKELEEKQEQELQWQRDRWVAAQELTTELHELFALQDQQEKEREALVEVKPEGVKAKGLEKQLEKLRNAVLDITVQIRTLENQIAKTEKLEAETQCPTCGQPIDFESVAEHFHLEDHQRRISKLNQELKDTNTEMKLLRQKLNQEKESNRTALDAYLVRSTALEGKVRVTGDNIERIALERIKLARGACPYNTRQLEADLEHRKQMAVAGTVDVDDANKRVAGLEFWSKAFREIRLGLIEDSLAQFEATANNALHALGLTDWSVGFAVEAENKSGTLRKGFTINVASPYNVQRVPFLTWSGGEAQRLCLAVALGFSDLVRDFSGNDCNIEIWDEGSQGLSEPGVQDLLEVLQTRAKQNNLAIFFIDHRLLEFGGFDRVVTITKGVEGSTITT